MPAYTLNSDTRRQLAQTLQPTRWLVCALCAEWCLTCKAYAAPFAALAQRFPEVDFIWADIEDESDFLQDPEIDNFPTLLIQRGAQTLFFGVTLPESAIAARLLENLQAMSEEERAAQALPDALNIFQLLQESEAKS
ncbi:thioredoxin domain-containing protein [Massilia sp. W12]|uniref:thioredoxin domain-containing protein n=1 Tax=Massilia sp. W12 TaxID=3126507 RepID=UPI0030CADE0B